MSDKLSYFSYFIASIIMIAAISKLMNLAIASSEDSRKNINSCIAELRPEGDSYFCVCEDKICEWKNK